MGPLYVPRTSLNTKTLTTSTAHLPPAMGEMSRSTVDRVSKSDSYSERLSLFLSLPSGSRDVLSPSVQGTPLFLFARGHGGSPPSPLG